MNSYDNTAYSVPKNKRNSGNNDALRENQSMGTYIPSSFNGVFLQNVKNAQDTKYDYEIGGDFGPKGKNIPNKIDNSMGQPSQVYGTEELKNSISLSFSGFPNKEQKKVSSLSPSNRSEENKTNFKNYNTNMINKVMNQKIKSRMKPAYENPSGDSSQLESISESNMERHEK